MFAPRSGGPLAFGAAVLLGLAALLLLHVLPAPLPLLVGWAAAVAAWGFFAQFFRDPNRTPGDGIVSAADGRVRDVRTVGPELLVSVFMNVTDVHVNRAPSAGTFVRVQDAGAGRRPAYRDDADQNVSRTYEMATPLGPVRIVQITGILARRLVSFVRAGATVGKGDRFGMIVLGSRVDVFLPSARLQPAVKVGDRVRAGVTTIARERT
ncbi:MAG: phosphatidylserine decarboxylase [Thermoplasmata archaeon]